MKTLTHVVLLVAIIHAFLFAPQDALAQDTKMQEVSSKSDSAAAAATEEADLAQLRMLRETLTQAVIKNDIATQLQYVRDDVVTTWQNNQVARGHDGLKTFMNEMNSGEERAFQGYTVPPSSDDIPIIYEGTTAIAFGRSTPHYKYLGKEFDLENRWTATLVKQDGEWKIASYHVSANLIDNPILDAALNSVVWTAIISVIIGLLLGVLGSRFFGNKHSAAA